MFRRPSLLLLGAVLSLSVVHAQTPPAGTPPVRIVPSQPRAIDIQPAVPGTPTATPDEALLPPKITLIPGVAPDSPAAPAEVAETPDETAEKVAIRQKAYLVGAWVYDVAMPHGEAGRQRLVIRYRDDGTFAGIVQFIEGTGRSDMRIGGKWMLVPLAGNRFRLDTVAEKAGASITIEILDQQRMLNLTNNVLMQRLTL